MDERAVDIGPSGVVCVDEDWFRWSDSRDIRDPIAVSRVRAGGGNANRHDCNDDGEIG